MVKTTLIPPYPRGAQKEVLMVLMIRDLLVEIYSEGSDTPFVLHTFTLRSGRASELLQRVLLERTFVYFPLNESYVSYNS